MIEKRLLDASKRPTGRFGDFRCWQILLQKSFLEVGLKFSAP
jgi:hypothetical protein